MKHLLSLSIGPVQEFIAAARKTADLQAGSGLLVAIAKKVAKVVEQHGELIFPANTQADAIPNKILIELKDGVEPQAIATQAKGAARKFLRDTWDTAKKDIPSNALDEPLAQDQIEHFLEFYAAWVPRSEDYAEDRKQVEHLMAGRKALRNFTQPMSRAGRPKSPLDPSRDCVLRTEANMAVPESCQKRLSLKRRETLDAVSLLKRMHGLEKAKTEEPFSTSMMAAKPVLMGARQEDCQRLMDLAGRLGLGRDYSDLLFPERTDDLLDEKIATGQIDTQEAEEFKHKIKEVRKAILGEKKCPPYYAILVADGDRMGQQLAKHDSIGAHQKFSQELAGFAGWAAQCVKQHDGHCVYTGGDDVLAFLPIHRVLDCAEAMEKEFIARIGATLSVGIAIVHHLENLQISLERARAAEKAAKKERNSLAVALHTRGGAPLIVAETWTADPVSEWKRWTQAFRGGLARGFPYELMELAREWPENGQPDNLRKEAERILGRKEGGTKPKLPLRLQSKDEWMHFACKLAIARFLAGYPEVNHA